MHLVVLNIAEPFARVGPDAAGAPEQLITTLDSCLVRAGHESIVMASEGSVVDGILLSTSAAPEVLHQTLRQRIHDQFRYILRQFLEKWPIDVIHMHGSDFYEYLPAAGIPVLVSLHLPAHCYPPEISRLARPHTVLDPIDDTFTKRFSEAQIMEKYLPLYESLVSEARVRDLIYDQSAAPAAETAIRSLP